MFEHAYRRLLKVRANRDQILQTILGMRGSRYLEGVGRAPMVDVTERRLGEQLSMLLIQTREMLRLERALFGG
ncbi:hypothetical protein FPZ24_08065 [Sphingomonas panacisoli]|uniref:Uncharacterized protein n=1 Tax=Sphingomonas panacisoli TaxID=1813879 RepID=A0A5B8LGM3_9SPHN|nr:hypothetical protein [Sphingomonas panacisoli]QDZ07438.1 hypothetical protein FPZ24_08065 [Sphingomonas panacisoli]